MQKTFRLKKEKLLEKLRRRGSNSADEASPSPSVSRQCSREVSREVAVDAPSTRSRHESPRSYAARNRSSNWTEEPVRSRPVSRQESLRREAREEREEREAAASSRDLGTPSPSSTRNTGFFTPMGVLPSTITNDAAVYTPEEDPIENDVPNHTDPKNEPKHEPKKEKEQEQNTEMDKMDLDKKPMSPIRIAPEELEIFVQEATPTPTQGGKFPVRKSSLQGRKVNGTEMPKVPKVETNGVTNGLTVSVPTTPLGNGLPSLSPTNSVLSTPTSPNPFSQVGLRQEPFRRQSLLPQNSQTLIRNLLTPSAPPVRPAPPQHQAPNPHSDGPYDSYHPHPHPPPQALIKIWVTRPSSSATLIPIPPTHLIDDLRDAILLKYRNALGRHYDAPDITLKVIPRLQLRPKSRALETAPELGGRWLSPEEVCGEVVERYFPGGQTAREALVVEVPPLQGYGGGTVVSTHPGAGGGQMQQGLGIGGPGLLGVGQRPRPSPTRFISEQEDGYFNVPRDYHVPSGPHSSSSAHPPALPSTPGSAAQSAASPESLRRPGQSAMRPRTTRLNTTTTATTLSSLPGSSTTTSPQAYTNAPILLRGRTTKVDFLDPSSPHYTLPNSEPPAILPVPSPPLSPPGSVTSPLKTTIPKSIGLPGGSVPPINVLIVEDNIINLRLLEAFMKRLKVRWHTATNGREAVLKWRRGGFHLVLMDIQLPIMSGLEATKEIRRLESINGVGVLGTEPPATVAERNGARLSRAVGGTVEGFRPGDGGGESPLAGVCWEGEREKVREEDRLERELFKSPVIIVALTASSLQSDRHEALAVGCNDFLTKPVSFLFLERKVTEWGCMQALIDYDGWREWKATAEQGKAPVRGRR